MFRSIGTVILLYFLFSTFASAPAAFESALVATFSAVETAANESTEILTETN